MLAEKYKKPFFCWADINILIIDDLSTLNSKDLYPNILIYWTTMQIRKFANCWISTHLILTTYLCRVRVSITENQSKNKNMPTCTEINDLIRQKLNLFNKWRTKVQKEKHNQLLDRSKHGFIKIQGKKPVTLLKCSIVS